MPDRRFLAALLISLVLHAAALVSWRWPLPDNDPAVTQVYLSATVQERKPPVPSPAKTDEPISRRILSRKAPGGPVVPVPTPAPFPESPPPPVPDLPQTEEARVAFLPAPPEYPAEARRRGLEGCVLAAVSVSADGTVTGVDVLETDHPGIFDQSMRAAQESARYQPALLNGNPVSSRVLAVASFVLVPERRINCAMRFAERAKRLATQGSDR